MVYAIIKVELFLDRRGGGTMNATAYFANPLFWFGLVSIGLVSISDVSYIRDIYRREAQPHRMTWFIFVMTSAVAFATQLSIGASTSLFVFGWFVLVNTTIFVLTLTPGRGLGGSEPWEWLALVLAIGSLGIWVKLNAPLWALVCVLVADSIGIGMTAKKTWVQPFSEPRLMWGLGSISGIFSILAVGSGQEGSLYLAPIHFFLCDVLIYTIIVSRRRTISPPD